MTDDALQAFRGLADGTRMDIVAALIEARREDPESPALTFSELRDRAGVADSGRFNYHLDKLVGQFVVRTEEGYRLNVAGRNVAGALAAGVYADYDPDPEPLDESCLVCGSPVTAVFEDGAIQVTCDGEHEHLLFAADFPAGAAADRSIRETIDLATREITHSLEFAVEGVCPECYGEMARSVETARMDPEEVHVLRAACGDCGNFTRSAVGVCLVVDPTVRTFYRDHGVDVRERIPWTLEVFDAEKWTRTAEDPVELRFETTRDGEGLSVTVDDRGRVVEAVRE
jgi:DNA-binding transcriptional ArsR family regulator